MQAHPGSSKVRCWNQVIADGLVFNDVQRIVFNTERTLLRKNVQMRKVVHQRLLYSNGTATASLRTSKQHVEPQNVQELSQHRTASFQFHGDSLETMSFFLDLRIIACSRDQAKLSPL
jgi:hypothetical protein